MLSVRVPLKPATTGLKDTAEPLGRKAWRLGRLCSNGLLARSHKLWHWGAAGFGKKPRDSGFQELPQPNLKPLPDSDSI